jgi:hypothetical protein
MCSISVRLEVNNTICMGAARHSTGHCTAQALDIKSAPPDGSVFCPAPFSDLSIPPNPFLSPDFEPAGGASSAKKIQHTQASPSSTSTYTQGT